MLGMLADAYRQEYDDRQEARDRIMNMQERVHMDNKAEVIQELREAKQAFTRHHNQNRMREVQCSIHDKNKKREIDNLTACAKAFDKERKRDEAAAMSM